MGKLARLASVKSAKTDSFTYIPPDAAFGAVRILVKADLGTVKSPPETVSMRVLEGVLRGLRRANPGARILIVEGVRVRFDAMEVLKNSGLLNIIDENTRVTDSEAMPMAEYPNLLQTPHKFATLTAPSMMGEYDCRISVSRFTCTTRGGNPLVEASLRNLHGIFPREQYSLPDTPHERGQFTGDDAAAVYKDLYFSMGHLFDGAVVDLDTIGVDGASKQVNQVVWGDDMLAVDEVACKLAGEPVPDYLREIDKLRQGMEK